MKSNRQPSSHPAKSTIALFGKKVPLKNSIGKMILTNRPNAFATTSNSFVMETNDSFKIISVPDFFDEECQHPDQLIIDFMALSHPGPDLFILAIDSENTKEDKVVAQIKNLKATFGDNITANLVIMLPDAKSLSSLRQLEQKFNTQLAVASENLASECKKWCSDHKSFQYNYENYSEDVVLRRMTALENISFDGHPVYHHGTAGDSACEDSDNIFNIVLLGLTGTGKSASANTILTADQSRGDPIQLFKSVPSPMMVTTQCEVRIVEKPFERKVRLVDTPDFFHDQIRNPQAQVDECKKYCKPGQCVVLLVLQLGRFTHLERGILEKLEKKLGWEIRESTIVLLTHGDDLKGSLEKFINAHDRLKSVVELCGDRCHLFNNNSKNTKQVTELIKKIPDYKDLFPKFAKKQSRSCCIL
ncbi:GTPase IMAP family member 8-like [Epinephelus fuscoguttatus]|uniref:GTPase IMAP family member 8-like n=1 Tax=Epinephelus fuscoguttatus TaxID=293821 RepID=UPI0020D0A68C|nr:GTPase IMAP family member 8-like [Epinephelus fuscoguttatus]